MQPVEQSSKLTVSSDQATVDQIVKRARESKQIAIDTEFIGEGHYRPLLCLVQIGISENGEQTDVYLLDPMAELPYKGLAELLADPEIELLMHAGKQDVAILRRVWKTEITNLFDTQVAAAFAGYGSQIGYSKLVHKLTNKQLAKSASFTYWDRRPLTQEQLSYAAEDVVDLHAVSTELKKRLDSQGRLTWAQEECTDIEATDDTLDPSDAYLKLSRVNRLKPDEVAVAKELCAWRERAASVQDQPTNYLISDVSLVELAKRKPDSKNQLLHIRGVQKAAVKQHGNELLAAVARGIEGQPIELPRQRISSPHGEDLAVVPLIESLIRQRAREVGIAYEVIINKATINQIVSHSRSDRLDQLDAKVLSGWRYELVGKEMLELLQGSLALSVDRRGVTAKKVS